MANTTSRKKQTFADWMHEIDLQVQRMIGLSIMDLPDCPYKDWYDDNVSISSAAAKVIRRTNE